MTPARIAALQWFHDRGVVIEPLPTEAPDIVMRRTMSKERHLEVTLEIFPSKVKRVYRLTDAGRQALHEATRK